ncbi:hypothetical protein [Streptomyces vietnamensis]|uniref:hypothetical protein n=1 Tax=Streptomyces vietnamensis TaxID=362257 RepID=UPI00343ADE3B
MTRTLPGARDLVATVAPAACVFEFDGTLVDTHTIDTDAARAALAARRLAVPAPRCLAFENTDEGIAAAHAARMTVIDVRRETWAVQHPQASAKESLHRGRAGNRPSRARPGSLCAPPGKTARWHRLAVLTGRPWALLLSDGAAGFRGT